MGLVCCGSWRCRVRHTEWLNWTELRHKISKILASICLKPHWVACFILNVCQSVAFQQGCMVWARCVQLLGRAGLLSPKLLSLSKGCGVSELSALVSPVRASQVVLAVKSLSANEGDIRDTGLIPDLGRCPGRGNCNPVQYSCLENPMDREAWPATVPRIANSWTWLKWPSVHVHTSSIKRG